ncbi:MAG: hypothetical protein HFI00_02415 [Lachnospiraceae bacterium]|nr:hypothetical protein [Lachnospiraceae bacterium]
MDGFRNREAERLNCYKNWGRTGGWLDGGIVAVINFLVCRGVVWGWKIGYFWICFCGQ